MNDKGEVQPSKVTEVLINKIHGGRKMDSKFWQSSHPDNVERKLPDNPSFDAKPFPFKKLLFPVSMVAATAAIFCLAFWFKPFIKEPKLLETDSSKFSSVPLPPQKSYVKPPDKKLS